MSEVASTKELKRVLGRKELLSIGIGQTIGSGTVSYTHLLIDEIREDPSILNREKYDLFATTINHHDEVWATVKHVVEGGDRIPVEKVVLSVSCLLYTSNSFVSK